MVAARRKKKVKQAQRREDRAIVRQWQRDETMMVRPPSPPPPSLLLPPPQRAPPPAPAVRVVNVKALDFHTGGLDPHWRYTLEVTSTVSDDRRDIYELRYSDVAGCEDVEASFLPGRHLVPWLGKLMDSRRDTELRASKLLATLRRLDQPQLKRFLASLLLRHEP